MEKTLKNHFTPYYKAWYFDAASTLMVQWFNGLFYWVLWVISIGACLVSLRNYVFSFIRKQGQRKKMFSSTDSFCKCPTSMGCTRRNPKLNPGLLLEWSLLTCLFAFIEWALAGVWIRSRVAETWKQQSNMSCQHPKLLLMPLSKWMT